LAALNSEPKEKKRKALHPVRREKKKNSRLQATGFPHSEPGSLGGERGKIESAVGRLQKQKKKSEVAQGEER